MTLHKIKTGIKNIVKDIESSPSPSEKRIKSAKDKIKKYNDFLTPENRSQVRDFITKGLNLIDLIVMRNKQREKEISSVNNKIEQLDVITHNALKSVKKLLVEYNKLPPRKDNEKKFDLYLKKIVKLYKDIPDKEKSLIRPYIESTKNILKMIKTKNEALKRKRESYQKDIKNFNANGNGKKTKASQRSGLKEGGDVTVDALEKERRLTYIPIAERNNDNQEENKDLRNRKEAQKPSAPSSEKAERRVTDIPVAKCGKNKDKKNKKKNKKVKSFRQSTTRRQLTHMPVI